VILKKTFISPAGRIAASVRAAYLPSSTAFLQALRPQWAVVQAGYRNRFGHPAPEVVARYHDLQIQWVDSPHCGAASWRSDRPKQLVCERARSRRYWHHLPP
jgi:competence protein ComEC